MSTHSSTNHTDQRSFPELIRELRDESTALLRQEVALAKTEMSEKASRVSSNAITLIVGGAIAHLGLIFLLLAVSEGLQLAFIAANLPFHGRWLAPLIVGVLVGIVGIGMALKAKKTLENTALVPEKTMQTLKDDKQWVKEKMR